MGVCVFRYEFDGGVELYCGFFGVVFVEED